ncbi:MAG TPA: hypothetical protein VGE07_08905 [Herpetosiphonaceae bacterium]
MAAPVSKRLAGGWPRLRRRAGALLAGGANTLLLPLLSPLVALLVIRLASAELWGGFVRVLLPVQLGAHLLVWGNRDYLLRAFSRQPARIAALWRSNLLTRLPLLMGALPPLMVLGVAPGRAALLLGWLLAGMVDQSCEALVAYRKTFGAQLAIDLAGLAGLAGGVAWLGEGLGMDGLIGLFALVEAAKALALTAWLGAWRQPANAGAGAAPPTPDWGYFRRALPFFLLGLTGLLQSRIDQYCAASLLAPGELAAYQVISNFLIYLQALAAVALTPLLKGLYRLPQASLLLLARRLLLAGLALLGPALAAVAVLLARLYRLAPAPRTLLIGGLSVIPIYYYLPVIHALYKAGRQRAVLWVNLAGTALNLPLALALLPALRIDGGLLANAAAQWLMLAAYLRLSRALGANDGAALPDLPRAA